MGLALQFRQYKKNDVRSGTTYKYLPISGAAAELAGNFTADIVVI